MPTKPRRHLNLQELESFVVLAEVGGVTAAARRLNLSQPTVSQHLQRLEEHLKRQLITRTREGATLTTEGMRLLPLARSLLRLDQQFGDSDAARSPLRLGACTNIGVYMLPSMLIDFRSRGEALPQVTIASNPEIRRQLICGELDIALLEWWDEPSGFEWQLWRKEPLVVILPFGHALGANQSLSLAELRSEPLLGGESGTGTGRLLRTHLDYQVAVVMKLGSTEAVKRAVAAGLGISLVLQASVLEHLTYPPASPSPSASPVSGASSGLLVKPIAPVLLKPLCLVWRTGLFHDHVLLDYLRGKASIGHEPAIAPFAYMATSDVA